MNKLYIAIVAMSILLCGCQKEDSPIFSKSADERINEKLSEYQKLLVSAKYGWKTAYFPKDLKTGGWSYIFKFKEDGSVTMMGDFNKTTATTEQPSKYRVCQIHKPSLIFDTYSMLHILADPEQSNPPGPSLQGDFEFEFLAYKNDTLSLVGIHDKTILKMVMATDKDISLEKNVARRAQAKAFFSDLPTRPYFKGVSIGSSSIDISYVDKSKKVIIRYSKNNTVYTLTRAVAFNEQGMVLSSPVTLPNVSKPVSTIAFSGDSPTELSLLWNNEGTPCMVQHMDYPVVPYIKELNTITQLEYFNIMRVSPSLKDVLDQAETIPNLKDLQLMFDAFVKEGAPRESALLAYCPEATKKNWFQYNLQWTYGDDGVLKGKYVGAVSGLEHESKVKPLINQLCNGDGYTVADISIQSFDKSSLVTATLISRANSQDRIFIYTFL